MPFSLNLFGWTGGGAGSGGTITGADNGLSVSGGVTVQLGGTLIKNTTIDFGLFSLNFNNFPTNNNNRYLLSLTSGGSIEAIDATSGGDGNIVQAISGDYTQVLGIYDNTGLLSVDYVLRTLNDSVGASSVDWENRRLYENNFIVFSWNNSNVTGLELSNIGSAFSGFILNSLLTANRSYELPNVSGTLTVDGWVYNGNTVGSVKSFGTIDNYDLPFITNSVEVARFYNTGKIVLGVGAVGTDISNVVIGNNAQSLINRGVAIGNSAISQSQGVSIGHSTNTNDRGVALGYSALSTGSSVAVGESSSSTSNGVSIGTSSISLGFIAIGFSSNNTGGGIVSLGNFAEASGTSAIAIGFRVQSSNTDTYTIGRSVDNATYLTNNVAQSFGIGWSEATPTVLFAKTATQYINGTGNLGIGLTGATAKLQIRGTGTTSGTNAFLVQNATPSTIFHVTDGRQVLVNGGGGDGEVFGVAKVSVNNRIFVVYTNSYNRLLGVYDDSTGGATGSYVQFGNVGTGSVFYHNVNAWTLLPATNPYYAISITGTPVSSNLILFNRGTGGGIDFYTDASHYFKMRFIETSGASTNHLVSSDGVTYFSTVATSQIGIGTATPNASAKLEVTSTTMGFRITPMTAAQASAITPAEGLQVFVSDTDATFTSIGLWSYENGAWAKL